MTNNIYQEDVIRSKFKELWKQTISDNPKIKPMKNPYGILLGGQPGAGKSFGTQKIQEKFKDNILVINGDEFRKLHPQYNELYKKHGKDASKYTGEFAGIMVHLMRERAIKERFNIVIEGTFRTTDTP